jgi:DNA (cytosine-5)-methyltransferase 1
MKIATVCSGIGAPEKALKNLGVDFELSYFCEIDKYAVESYCAIHNENENKNLSDLTQIKIEELPSDIDILVGGTPCQDFSSAGKGAGGNVDSGTRSSLMWNFVEIINQTKPKYVLWENVPGVLTDKHLPNYRKFCDRLTQIGYKVYSTILNAKNFGVPQNRERIFVLGIRKDLQQTFEFPTGYDCGIRLKDVLDLDVSEKYFISEQALKGMLETRFRTSSITNRLQGDICDTLAATDYKRGKVVIQENKPIELTQNQPQSYRVFDSKGIGVTLQAEAGGLGAKTGLYCVAVRGRKNNNGKYDLTPEVNPNGTTNALTTVQKDNLICLLTEKQLKTNNKRLKSMLNKIDVSKTQAIDMYNQSVNESMFTIKANINTSNMVAVSIDYRIRKLTPVECFRLMGFSDKDYELCSQNGISDSQLYKQAGNSIVVNVLMAIFGELLNIDWKQKVYGKWWKTEEERLYDLPLFQCLKNKEDL